MKRGLNADFKNVKIIWGSKNFFSKIFEIFLSPTRKISKNFEKKILQPKDIFTFSKQAFSPLFIKMVFI